MLILFDIGNTHIHVGLANSKRVLRKINLETAHWKSSAVQARLHRWLPRTRPDGAALCSVVPSVTPHVISMVKSRWNCRCLELTHRTLRGVGIDYPKPGTIGPDRLANAVAARHHFGAPAIVVDFGTAVTFDVIDRSGNYIGGIIAPGLAALTDYLHEKTALLPRIQIREPASVIGKNTEQAMQIGAVHGYRGLIRELITKLRGELKTTRLPVVATGGYAQLIAAKLPVIKAVEPCLTLEGLRLVWSNHEKRGAWSVERGASP